MSKKYLDSPAVEEAVKDYIRLKNRSDLKPLQFGQAREEVLSNFMHAIAEANDRVFKPLRIDANGEFRLFLDTEKGPDNYGDELVELISSQPRRTGVIEVSAAMLPENNWCMMNHFRVEALLKSVQQEIAQKPNQKHDTQTPSP